MPIVHHSQNTSILVVVLYLSLLLDWVAQINVILTGIHSLLLTLPRPVTDRPSFLISRHWKLCAQPPNLPTCNRGTIPVLWPDFYTFLSNSPNRFKAASLDTVCWSPPSDPTIYPSNKSWQKSTQWRDRNRQDRTPFSVMGQRDPGGVVVLPRSWNWQNPRRIRKSSIPKQTH